MKPESKMNCTPDVFDRLDEALKQRRERRRGKAAPPPDVEGLEARRLMSVNLSGSVLVITGTSGNDTVQVWQVNGTPTLIYVKEDNNPDQTNTAWTATAITRIDVSTGAGTDSVVGQIATETGRDPLTEKLNITGGADRDILKGGTAADTITGGDGDDDIYGYGDNDFLYGGYGGTDYIEGGNGNDLMYGGDGGAGGNIEVVRDDLRGEDGNDTLYGEGGNDDLDGGDGNDHMYGGGDGDALTGGNGSDYMSGEGGNDSFWAGGDNTYVDSLLGGAGSDVLQSYDAGVDTLLDTIPG